MESIRQLARRELLKQGGMLGLAGLGAASGLTARPGAALAADAQTVNIVNPAGSLTLVFEKLLAQEKFFQQVGVQANSLNVSDGSKVIAALVSGSGDLCAGGGFSGAFPAIEKGAPLKIVAGASVAPETAIFTKRPDIKEAKDLIGRTVGTGAPGALLHELVVGLLIKKGLDYTKVNFVNVGSGVDVFKAVAAGTVDAGPGEIDFYTQQQKYGVHVLTDGKLWDELPEYTNQAMLSSNHAIAEKRDVLVKALAAHLKMFRFVASPNSESAWRTARAAAYGTDDPTDAQAQWAFFNAPGHLATGLVLTPDKIQYIQQLNVRLGVQKTILPFEQVADMSIAQDALKLVGA